MLLLFCLNLILSLVLEVLTEFSCMILILSETCTSVSFHESQCRQNTIAGRLVKASEYNSLETTKDLKVAVVRDLITVHYNAVDKEIRLFL